MDIKDLVQLSSQKVRLSPDLMAIYIKAYREVFGNTPNCAGCTFSSDFTKLKRVVFSGKKQNTKIKNTMKTEQTFKLKKRQGKIYSYKREGKTIHFYDTNMTEQLAVEFLTHGSEAQIEERKKLFAVLPKFPESTESDTADSTKSEGVIINGDDYTLEAAIEFLEQQGTPTRATTIKGVQGFVNKLSS